MIKIRNLHKSYKNLNVLNGINLDIHRGGIFCILGPNGSGKTTLIKSILGIIIPDKGDILINENSINEKWEYRNNIDYLPQIANFPNNLNVIELINMIKNLRKSQTKETDLISLFKLAPFLNKKLGNLSGGTRQKVNILLAFMFDSELIILDEPTTGLDPISLITLKKLIRKEKEENNKTILITSHLMDFVEEISDEIIFLLEGKIYFKGRISDLKQKTNTDNFENAIASILDKNYV